MAGSAARERVVGEGRVGTNENVVLDPDAIPQLHAGLDGDPIADLHVVLDKNVITEVAVLADARPRQDVREGPDARAVANLRRLAQAERMNEMAHRCSLALRAVPPRGHRLPWAARRKAHVPWSLRS